MRSWNMFNEMNAMNREFNKLFGSGFGRSVLMPEVVTDSHRRLVVREDDDNFYVEAILPGIDAKNLDMNVTGNLLSLSASQSDSADKKSDNRADNRAPLWHRRERSNTTFARTIKLRSEIDSQKSEAQYRDGVLTVTLPKVEAAKPKRIEIKTA